MKKNGVMLLCLLLLIQLAGCNEIRVVNQKVMRPSAITDPIAGQWQIIKIISNDRIARSIQQRWIHKYALFSRNFVSVGDYLFQNPSFNLRTVNPSEYLEMNHRSINNVMKIPETADVITVTGRDKYFCEVMKLAPTVILLEIYNYNLVLKKVSDKLDMHLYTALCKAQASNSTTVSGSLRTGVMIGLRTPVGSTDLMQDSYTYRTLYIAASNRKLIAREETKDIFFPRKNGFWKLNIKRTTENNQIKDILHSYNIIIGSNTGLLDRRMMLFMEGKPILTETNRLDYVGNDFASIETTHFQNGKAVTEYHIVPIDSLPNIRPVTLNDVMDRNGNHFSDINARNLIHIVDKMGYQIDDRNHINGNYGLTRKEGHWNFIGRINYHKGQDIRFQDYRINVIPPSNLIFYDELSVSWENICKRVSEAKDAYTSPNKDLAIILDAHNKLYVYSISSGSLSKKPLETIALKQNESVVMAEWATGSYVENWEKSFSGLQ